jgi:hypothetical protein
MHHPEDKRVMPPMSTPSTNPAPEQQSTRPKRLGNTFAYASVLCSLAFWVGFVLSYFPSKIRFDFNAFNWLRLMAAAILLAVVARFCGSQAWKRALTVALVTAFFAMYITGG